MSEEDEEKLRNKNALKLLFYDDAECSKTEILSETNENCGFISPFVSSIRGSQINSSNRKFERIGFTPGSIGPPEVLDDKANILSKRLSFENVTVSDLDFFDSETGMKMILSDQENMEKEYTLQHCDPNVTGCSSWIPMTSKKSSELTMNTDFSRNQSLYTSVGEYIAKRSEDLIPLSDDTIHKKAFFGCDASTPVRVPVETSWNDTKMKDLSDFSTVNSTLSKQSGILPWETTRRAMPWENPMGLALLYATPKATRDESFPDYKFYIGTTCKKKIQRLRAEENAIRNCQKQSERDFLHSDEDKTISSCSSRDGTQEWSIEPQELVLDSNKGHRVLLINNSKQVLKFKTKFDGNLINVSPLSGTVPAKGRIGLRIIVLSTRRQSGDVDTTINIIASGNVEQSIHVKILKEKRKTSSVKGRSYILF